MPCVQVTPFLLERIRTLTGGGSLVANIKLVMNNAAIGAQMAKAYARQQKTRNQMKCKL